MAPELSDPSINPEVLYSKLAIGAMVRHHEGQRFSQGLPMAFLEPATVEAVRSRFVPDAAVTPPEPGQPPSAPTIEEPVEEPAVKQAKPAEEPAPATPPARLRPGAPDEGLRPRRPRTMPGIRERNEPQTPGNQAGSSPAGGGTAPRIPNVSPEGPI